MNADDAHGLRLSGRSELEISGVRHVASFDVEDFQLMTTAGLLHIQGSALHMKHFDMDAGVVRIQGKITSLQYEDDAKRRNFVGRLLR